MRVIAGLARGRPLVAPKGRAVRPTSDRLREALFSVLGERVRESSFWDACAGTGAVGIEALSRGARRAVFSEPAAEALAALRANLLRTALGASAHVLELGCETAARLLGERGARFDLIYYDPPYARARQGDFLALAAELLREGGLVLVEHPSRDQVAGAAGLACTRRLVAGSSCVSILGFTVQSRGPMEGDERGTRTGI